MNLAEKQAETSRSDHDRLSANPASVEAMTGWLFPR